MPYALETANLVLHLRHTGMIRIGNEPYERWLACPGKAAPEWIVRSVLSIAAPPRPV
jgi:hypothetical protein